jgi:hypothetical protein
MGIFTNIDKGGFNIFIEHGQDHNHVMSQQAEVIQSDDEGSIKQDGMDFLKAATPGSRSHSMTVKPNQGRSQGSRAGCGQRILQGRSSYSNSLMWFIERIRCFHVGTCGSLKARQYRSWWNTTSRPNESWHQPILGSPCHHNSTGRI